MRLTLLLVRFLLLNHHAAQIESRNSIRKVLENRFSNQRKALLVVALDLLVNHVWVLGVASLVVFVLFFILRAAHRTNNDRVRL